MIKYSANEKIESERVCERDGIGGIFKSDGLLN